MCHVKQTNYRVTLTGLNSSFRLFVVEGRLVWLHLISGVLVLLVLRDEVVHVGLGLGELHLVHALAGVPVKESLATKHGRELLRDALEQLLDRRVVADECCAHFETSARSNTSTITISLDLLLT